MDHRISVFDVYVDDLFASIKTDRQGGLEQNGRPGVTRAVDLHRVHTGGGEEHDSVRSINVAVNKIKVGVQGHTPAVPQTEMSLVLTGLSRA